MTDLSGDATRGPAQPQGEWTPEDAKRARDTQPLRDVVPQEPAVETPSAAPKTNFLEPGATKPMGLAPQYQREIKTEAPAAPVGQLFEAAFLRENSLGSLATRLARGPMSAPDPEFDPWQHIKGYEDYASSFSGANSLEDVGRIARSIDQERRRADLLENGGAMGMLAELAAGIADPINLVPVGGELLRIGRMGERVASGALRVGAAGAVGAAGSEAVFQATQNTRTLGESGINVAAGALFSGILGGAVGAFAGRDMNAIVRGAMHNTQEFADELGGNLNAVRGGRAGAEAGEDLGGGVPAMSGSLSAAATRDTTLGQETMTSALGMEKALARTSPTLRIGSSPSIETRRIGQDLAEQPLQFRKNAEGIETPVSTEAIIRQWQWPLAKSLNDVDDLFVSYRMERPKQTGDMARIGLADTFGRSGDKLTREQFMEQVGRAMRRADEHEIPEVARAAKTMRETLFDPLKERAIKADLLPEDVDVGTALSYLSRLYNREKIAAQRPEFERRITDWLSDEQAKKHEIKGKIEPLVAEQAGHEATLGRLDAAGHEIETAKGRLAAIQSEIEGHVGAWEGKTSREAKAALERRAEAGAGREEGAPRLKGADRAVRDAAERMLASNTRLDRLDLQDISRQIVDRIMSSPVGRMPYDVETPHPGGYSKGDRPDTLKGPLKSRSFMIPDHLIEDFLESDIQQVARTYARTMAPDVELANRFGRVDMMDQFKKIQEEYAVLRNRVDPGDEAALKKLNDQMNGDLRDLSAVRDRLRGTFGLPDDPMSLTSRTFRVVRDLNYLRLLGGMTISALPDVGSVVMQHGFMRVFGDGLAPMVANFKKFSLARDEVKMAGEALDMVLDQRAMAMADIMDDYGRFSKFERGLGAMTQKFGIVSLMAPWNAAMKQFAGVIGQTRSLEAIERIMAGGKISQGELTRLAHFGIGPEMAQRIGKEFAEHGETVGSLKWANTDKWTDAEARTIYRASIANEVNKVIVTPGQEKPLWMSTEMGKIIGQFKSFNLSGMQRITMTGLQKRDMASLQGAVTMIGLGSLVYGIKADHDKLSDDPAVWVKEGLDRSGLTGWLFDVNNIVEKFTGGAVGASRLVNGPMASRYASRGVLASVLGPSAGLIEDVAGIVAAGTRDLTGAPGQWKESDSHAVRRMVPLQNLLGWKYLFDAAERGANEAFGVPMKKAG